VDLQHPLEASQALVEAETVQANIQQMDLETNVRENPLHPLEANRALPVKVEKVL
jgi:hypothetical protein